MKIIFILSWIVLFSASLYSQEQPIKSQHISPPEVIGNPYGVGMGMGGFGGITGTVPEKVKVEDHPQITITIGKDKSVSCELDNESKSYVCPNNGKPILVKYGPFGFAAITKNAKNVVTSPQINHVEAGGKTIYATPVFSGLIGGFGAGFKIDDTSDLSRDYTMKLMTINSFFETYDLPGKKAERKKGSEAYQKIANIFMEEKVQIEADIEKIYQEPNYSVELQDGQKLNCTRGSRRALSAEYKDYEARIGKKLQCGSFKCDPVKVDGKEYEATMLYESTPGSMANGSIHLMDKDGIGPNISIKKISSPISTVPLVDNSYYLENADKSYNNHFASSMLPASLKQDRDKIMTYKDPGFEQLLTYYQMICNDDNKALSNLTEGRNKLIAKLGELQLAEFIQVLENGSLVGQFVDPTLAPELGCLYQGVYLNQEAAKNLNRLKKNIHPDSHVDQSISLERATKLFKKASMMDDIAWKYKPDGCYARAHLMARRFEAEGVRVDKVWIKGDLYVPGTEPLIQWNFHVAPIVYVDDGKGNIQKMVIDPSLFSKPVTVEEWDNKMSKKTAKGSVVTAFPFPENSAFMERSTLSFSSSDPYLPGDSINMSEVEKMDQANMTMRMYKPMESK